jgi:fibronectin type 3 domain-containing protein
MTLVLLMMLGYPVQLSWNPNPPAQHVTSYKIYRAAGSGPYAALGEVTQTKAIDRQAHAPGQKYCYEVSAINKNGESPTSAPSCVTIPGK